jgi:hypothetical protein
MTTSTKHNVTSSQVDHEELQRKQHLAHEIFCNFPPDIRTRLLVVSRKSYRLAIMLNNGKWKSFVRALRGVSLPHQWNDQSLAELACEVESRTPHLLDT